MYSQGTRHAVDAVPDRAGAEAAPGARDERASPVLVADGVAGMIDVVGDHLTVMLTDSDRPLRGGLILQRRPRLRAMPEPEVLLLLVEVLDVERPERPQANTGVRSSIETRGWITAI